MKILKKVLGVMLVLSLLVVLNVSAMAYDITIYGGDSGQINGQSTYTDSVNVTTDIVTVTNDKYFAKGFVLAGHGSYDYDGVQQYTATLNLETDKDVDYVVVYGVKATQVSYTVRYIGPDGNALGAETVYYGNDSDYVYIAAPYFDGYTVSTVNGVALNGAFYAGITIHEGTEIEFVYAANTTAAAATAVCC